MESKDLFLTLEKELRELIEKTEIEIMELEISPGPDLLNSIFRSVHTIKGNAGMVGMKNLQSLSHSLETLFSRLRSGEMQVNEAIMDLIFQSIDRLKEIILNLQNESGYDVSGLILALEKILSKDSAEEIKEDEVIIKESKLFTDEELENYTNLAKSENKFLAIVSLDTGNFSSLGEFLHNLEHLFENILWKGIRIADVPALSPGQSVYPIPFSILITGKEPVEPLLEKYSCKYYNIEYVYSPLVNTSQSDANVETGFKPVSTTESSRDTTKNAYLKIPTKFIDELINLAGEAVIARNQFLQTFKTEDDSEEEIGINRLSQHINLIYNRLMKVRLQKMGSIFPRLQRVVRDASRTVGKDVRIHLEGSEIELDEVAMEGITESLLHILRNSIDHGIELENERIVKGKPKNGNIFFNTYLKSGNIHIQIKDDGKGLDHERIRERAVERKLISKEEAGNYSREKLVDLIFLPGFSTSEKVTEVSGRGVGMDVVLTNFKKFGGSVRIESEKDKGTSITGVIPQTLSVMPAFIISVKETKFAIMQKHIMELNKYTSDNILILDNRKIYKLREKMIPLIPLEELLFPNEKKESRQENIAVLQSEEKFFAVSFDQLISIEEIVLKPVPEQIKEIQLFDGITLAGDGSAILLLEPEAIIKQSGLQIEKSVSEKKNSNTEHTINQNQLIFETSGQLFIIPAVSVLHVDRIVRLDIQDVLGREMVNLEGYLIPALRLENSFNLRQVDDPNSLFCIRLRKDGHESGLVVHNIVDIDDSMEIKENTTINNGLVLGHAFVDGKVALYIDIFRALNENLKEAVR